MVSFKNITVAALCLSLFAIGCAPKKNSKQNIRGRLSRGATAATTPSGQAASALFNGASWGTVSGYDMNFSYAAQTLAQGILVGTGEQIGNVSPQPMQNKGVFFAGAGLPHYNSGTITTGNLLIEIWDDYAGQIGSDGQPIPPVQLFIGPGSEGFVGVSGQAFGGQITLSFATQYEVITLQGYVQGQEFVGTLMFSNSAAQDMTLGQFRVQACGFFRCQ